MRTEQLFPRPKYLDALLKRQWNERIKVVTGLRRCGKSTLLLKLFRQNLLDRGVPAEQIITLSLDEERLSQLRDPAQLSDYLYSKIQDPAGEYYVLLDEVQYAISRAELLNHDEPVRLYGVLNGLLHLGNVDVYVTGSNSKLLSRDIATEFRGRGDVVAVYPLSFAEFQPLSGLEKHAALETYLQYGGLPYLLKVAAEEDKYQYLKDLFDEIYFKDIEERYQVNLPNVLRELNLVLCSTVGSLTNAGKIARTLESVRHLKVDSETIATYLGYLTDSFLFTKAQRFDVKGKRYFSYPAKYYCTDLGLRNAGLEMRQNEESHLLENCLFNELLCRGCRVDVGVMPLMNKDCAGHWHQQSCEIDFVVNKGARKYYIQSALYMEDESKIATELRPLHAVNDSFKKIVISKSYGKSWVDEQGILRINPVDFLLDEHSLER